MTSTVPSESIRRRFGQLRITKTLIDQVVDRTGSNAQAAWNAMMCDFVVLQVEECRMTGSLRYTGYHPQFEEQSDDFACFTPREYNAEISQRIEAHNITTFEVKFRRM